MLPRSVEKPRLSLMRGPKGPVPSHAYKTADGATSTVPISITRFAVFGLAQTDAGDASDARVPGGMKLAFERYPLAIHPRCPAADDRSLGLSDHHGDPGIHTIGKEEGGDAPPHGQR